MAVVKQPNLVLEEIVKLRDQRIRRLEKDKRALQAELAEMQAKLAVSEQSGRYLARLFAHYNQDDGE